MEHGNIIEPNNQIEPTWNITLKIWWWITWHSILIALPGAFLIGLFLGLLLATKAALDAARPFLLLFSFMFGLSVHIYFFKKVLNRRFKGFILSLTQSNDEVMSEGMQYECSECGTSVQADANVCPKCGVRL